MDNDFDFCDSYYIGLRFAKGFDASAVATVDLRETVTEFSALIDVARTNK